jgi:hypothetical protein
MNQQQQLHLISGGTQDKPFETYRNSSVMMQPINQYQLRQDEPTTTIIVHIIIIRRGPTNMEEQQNSVNEAVQLAQR